MGLVVLPEDGREEWATSEPDVGTLLHRGRKAGLQRPGEQPEGRGTGHGGCRPPQDVPGYLGQDRGGGLGTRADRGCSKDRGGWGRGEAGEPDARNPEPEADRESEEGEETMAVGVLALCSGMVSLLGPRSSWMRWVTRRVSRLCWSRTLCLVKSGCWVGASSTKCRLW